MSIKRTLATVLMIDKTYIDYIYESDKRDEPEMGDYNSQIRVFGLQRLSDWRFIGLILCAFSLSTGIDYRNVLQLYLLGCWCCIDACDDVVDRVILLVDGTDRYFPQPYAVIRLQP